MASGRRLAASAILILVGLALIGFFGLLFTIADCTQQCEARGERGPVFAFIGTGVGLVVMGARLIPAGALRGVGWGALAGGAVIVAGCVWVLAGGGRGPQVYVPLGVGLGDMAVGAWLGFWRPR